MTTTNTTAKANAPTDMAAVMARLAALEAENVALKAAVPKPGKLRYKVSEKGAISVIGLGQWPATYYREQWLRILDQAEDLRKFIDSQEAILKTMGTFTKQV